MPATQWPATATPITISAIMIVMRKEYSIRALPERSRHRRTKIFTSAPSRFSAPPLPAFIPNRCDVQLKRVTGDLRWQDLAEQRTERARNRLCDGLEVVGAADFVEGCGDRRLHVGFPGDIDTAEAGPVRIELSWLPPQSSGLNVCRTAGEFAGRGTSC
jgi:hypothetical protein